jgi:hypothetical protein
MVSSADQGLQNIGNCDIILLGVAPPHRTTCGKRILRIVESISRRSGKPDGKLTAPKLRE